MIHLKLVHGYIIAALQGIATGAVKGWRRSDQDGKS